MVSATSVAMESMSMLGVGMLLQPGDLMDGLPEKNGYLGGCWKKGTTNNSVTLVPGFE
jgi:hypothetical protein